MVGQGHQVLRGVSVASVIVREYLTGPAKASTGGLSPSKTSWPEAWNGNRDPAGWTDPKRFDITTERTTKARALTFGAGIHYCLGANLARAELQEALAFLAPRMRDLRLDGEPRFESVHGVYGLEALPIAFSV